VSPETSTSGLSRKVGGDHGVEGSKPLELRWFELSELLSIDMRPQALQQALASGSLPMHFVERDRYAA
jgi:hypothetical protein